MQNCILTESQIKEVMDFVSKQPLYNILQFTREEIDLKDPNKNPTDTIKEAVKRRIETMSDYSLNDYYHKIVIPNMTGKAVPDKIKRLNKIITEYATAYPDDKGKMCWILDLSFYDLPKILEELRHIFKKNIFPDGEYNAAIYKTGIQINLTEIIQTVNDPDTNHPMLLSPGNDDIPTGKKRLHVRCYYDSFCDTYIDVPKDMNLTDAFQYASENCQELPITNITPLEDSAELDLDDSDNSKHTYFE